MRFRFFIVGMLAPLAALGCGAQKTDPALKANSEILNKDPQIAIDSIDAVADSGAAGATAVPALIKALASDNKDVRWRAARALENIGPKASLSTAALIKTLGDDAPDVRAHAARALGALGDKNTATIDALAALVTDKHARVRRAVIGAITQLNPGPEVTIPLMVNVLEDADPSVVVPALQTLAERGPEAVPGLIEALSHPKGRYWATLVLAEMGPAAKSAVPALGGLLDDPDPEVRMQSALALGEMGIDAAAAEARLVKGLSDKADAVRYACTFALGKVGATGAIAELEKSEADKDPFLAMLSAWAVAKLKPDDQAAVNKAVELIVAALKSENANVRHGAAKALIELNAPREIVGPPLVAALDDSDPEVQENIYGALASMGEAILPRVVERLRDPATRDKALHVLSRMGPAAAGGVPVIVELLDSVEPAQRREMLFALANVGPAAAEATAALVKALDDPDEDVRVAAGIALGAIGPGATGAVEALQKNLKSTDEVLRLISVEALLHIQPDDSQITGSAIPVLSDLLKDGKTDVTRIEAATALGDLGAKAKGGVPALERALKDEDPAVRDAATEALKKIRG
ncbi:MAG TPA: HEAT repeat domain-containing protein [Pirellulales bacterium]